MSLRTRNFGTHLVASFFKSVRTAVSPLVPTPIALYKCARSEQLTLYLLPYGPIAQLVRP